MYIHTISSLNLQHVMIGSAKKTVWAILLLAATVALVYQLTNLTRQFLKYDNLVSIERKARVEAVFPAVTVCNLSPLRESAWTQYKDSWATPDSGASAALLSRHKRASENLLFIISYTVQCYYEHNLTKQIRV